MWALRAAVRPGARLSRVTPGCRAPRAAPLLPPCPERALAASRGGLAGSEGRGGGGRGPRADGRRGRAGEQEGEEEPEEAEEAEELLRRDPLLPAGAQRVCLVHPDIKWGPGKPQGTRAEWQVAEARALVHTLDGWSVVDTVVAPTKAPDRKLVFGRGTLERLTEKIRGSPETTAVFLNLERVAAPTKKELEAAWGVPVFDRFTVVLHIFRCNARTKEARLQVALAELPLLRRVFPGGATASPERQGSEDPEGPGQTPPEEAPPGAAAEAAGVPRGLPGRVHELRKDHVGQGPDGGRRPAAPGPALCHAGRHGPRGGAALPAHRHLHGHHRLPLPAAPQPGGVLLGHPAGRGAFGPARARARREPRRDGAAEGQRAVGPAGPAPAAAAAGAHAGGAQQGGPAARVQTRGARRRGRVRAPGARAGGAEGPAAGRGSESHGETRPHSPRAAGGAAAEVRRACPAGGVVAPVAAAASPAPSRCPAGRAHAGPPRSRKSRWGRGGSVGVSLPHQTRLPPSWLHQEATVQAVDVMPEAGAADVKVIISDSAHGRFRKLFPG
ncbi:putative GTP-binding protein 6 isoform X2 [Hippopotamus amphibius kiboko]|uniref:putative GTP-binding protein 6 isoform X2 n=1 Tax=Hippopotamus amphibius kiboko TaxID=575201 RepID=UPI002597A8B3|nr:putative GTP-binding protein 6 isoform X2 [Hippopotamus amphibius kiboko]